MRSKLSVLVVTLTLISGPSALCQAPEVWEDPAEVLAGAPERTEWQPVSGTGVHYFSSAIVHSTEPTATGLVQRSTETVDLSGDLSGRLLYQPITVIDFAAGTLVNTGHQIYSGTVLGSAPVLLHDDEFRFEVDLTTGATTGVVHLVDRIAGPRTRCHLQVVGTGITPEGNATFDYAGECKVQESAKHREAKESPRP